MGVLDDRELATLQQSIDFLLNTNYSVQGPPLTPYAGPDAVGTRFPVYDEFIRVLPFEEFNLDPLGGVVASRPVASSVDTPAYLPRPAPTSSTDPPTVGAAWFVAGATVESVLLEVEPTVNADYERFWFKRLGGNLEFDKLQAQMLAKRSGRTSGPEPIPTMLRAASVALVRQLSRDALNSVALWPGGATTAADATRLIGLAKLYDDAMGTPGADPQVLRAGMSYTVLGEVRKLIRRVTPSGGGTGQGANALVMSQRARELMLTQIHNAGISPTFLPDAHGDLRFHFDGVPVYVGPVREDELYEISGTPQTVPSYPTVANAPSPYTYDRTSIYAMRLGGPSGVRILHVGGRPDEYGVQIEENRSAGSSSMLGYKVHGYYTLYVPERQACARLWGVDISSHAP